jgi:PAS domain S-box-containing protein
MNKGIGITACVFCISIVIGHVLFSDQTEVSKQNIANNTQYHALEFSRAWRDSYQTTALLLKEKLGALPQYSSDQRFTEALKKLENRTPQIMAIGLLEHYYDGLQEVTLISKPSTGNFLSVSQIKILSQMHTSDGNNTASIGGVAGREFSIISSAMIEGKNANYQYLAVINLQALLKERFGLNTYLSEHYNLSLSPPLPSDNDAIESINRSFPITMSDRSLAYLSPKSTSNYFAASSFQLFFLFILFSIFLSLLTWLLFKQQERFTKEKRNETTPQSNITTSKLQVDATKKEQHKHFHPILDALDVIVVTINSDGNVNFINKCGKAFYEYDAQSLNSLEFADLFAEPDRDRCRFLFDSLLTSTSTLLTDNEREVRLNSKGHETSWGRLSVSVHKNQDSPLFIATIVDVSEHRALELTLQQKTQEAVEANASKSLFLAKMSHEIRTPLHGVLGAVQVLTCVTDPIKQTEILNGAMASGKHLSSIINDILDLSKAEQKEMTFEKVAFNINKVVKRVCNEVSPTARKNNVNIILDIIPMENEAIVSDPTRIGQVIVNLLGNAVKFTKNDNVSLSIGVDRSPGSKESLQIRVVDRGIGISKVAQKDLFIPFRQADNSTTRKHGGSGLGLTISKHICEQLGGALTCQSQIGYGSTFTANIPVSVAEINEDEEKERSTNNAEVELRACKILIAEDNAINAQFLSYMLESQHCVIQMAKNGLEAIALFHRFKPDIVLMDINMPELDGVEACSVIRESDAVTPILAVTANVMRDEVVSYLDSGFSGHVPKPVIRDTIVTEINTQLTKYKTVS